MSPGNMEHLWDAYRDGELDSTQRAAFEAWLASDAAARRRYEAETRWLTQLAGDQGVTGGETFTRRTVQAWQAKRSGVLGRLSWGTLGLSAGSLAAVLAVAALLWWQPRPQPPVSPPLAHEPQPGESPSPVTLLLADADTLIEQPQRVKQAVEQSLTQWRPSRLGGVIRLPQAPPWLQPLLAPPAQTQPRRDGPAAAPAEASALA